MEIIYHNLDTLTFSTFSKFRISLTRWKWRDMMGFYLNFSTLSWIHLIYIFNESNHNNSFLYESHFIGVGLICVRLWLVFSALFLDQWLPILGKSYLEGQQRDHLPIGGSTARCAHSNAAGQHRHPGEDVHVCGERALLETVSGNTSDP